MNSGSSLSGLRVIITRSPDRAQALADAVTAAGARPVLMPLIDFETSPEPQQLDNALQRLAAGSYDWLVISSITAVRALKQWAGARGVTLAGLIPPSTKVATIGPSSCRALESEGVDVDLAPGERQSAAGLIAIWPSGAGRVLLPQADIAEATLRRGLENAGAKVSCVAAYRTVDYPASPDRRLIVPLGGGDSARATGMHLPETFTPEQIRAELSDGDPAAVVAASASAARRIIGTLGVLPESVLFIAIGDTTAAAAESLGQPVAAVAPEPTPAGIVAALTAAFGASNHLSSDLPVASNPKEIP